jgi:hypothetical protein
MHHDVCLNCYRRLFSTSVIPAPLTAALQLPLHLPANRICIYIVVCTELQGSGSESERLICNQSDEFYNNLIATVCCNGYVGRNSISPFSFNRHFCIDHLKHKPILCGYVTQILHFKPK